ncbi:hypothetical protein F4809DRAFT_665751 [Biscogniauxia mediterranea]|nr:hypothetical protein F4809DRAFT_665751 [Biscogniauxia mediterranea]
MHDPPFDDLLLGMFVIPVTEQQHDDTTAVSNPFETPEPTIDPSLLTPLRPVYDGAYLHGLGQGQSVLANLENPELELTGDGFLDKNWAWLSQIPCIHCRRLRPQCLVYQTTLHNPNPVRCPSCAAHFRDCSLAEQGKRQASYFETPQPVIGHLHGITDEEFILPPGDPSKPQVTSDNVSSQIGNKRSHSRSVHKTQPLSNWLSAHKDNPYPSEQAKLRLMEQSGLSRTQVTDWFTNARRRHRLSSRSSSRKIFPQGPPMPSISFTSLSPFERWCNSPPNEEPVSALVIENALRGLVSAATHPGRSSSSLDDNKSAATSSMPSLYRTSDSAASASASASAPSSCYSLSSAASSPSPRRAPPPPPPPLFPCPDCPRRFKKWSDLRRHRTCVHGARDGSSTVWTCGLPLPAGAALSVWRVGQARPQCVLCGHELEDGDEDGRRHFRTHEFEACGRRPVDHRTFARKDHLWQHLYKFHGCRKWEGWVPDLTALRRERPAIERAGRGVLR